MTMASGYSSNGSSSSSLCDVEALRARLEEKENIIQTAAQYGKDLLDENRELAQSQEDANMRYTRQLEVLKEENYSLTQRLEQKGKMEEEYQDEIDSLKKHLTSQREELKFLNELKDQSALISELRSRTREMESASEQLEIDRKHLAGTVASYEELVNELRDKLSALQDINNDTASDEMSTLLSELNDVSSSRDELHRACQMKENEVHSLTQQVESHVHHISCLQEELSAANSQLSGLSNSFMAATQENQELRCEIDVLRMNDRDHKKKGNSMFTELDDKRQEAEKRLLLLNVKHESLINQYDLSKKQMAKLKLQMSNILRMASGQVDANHVAELESQLAESRTELQSLKTRLAKLSSTEGGAISKTIISREGDQRTLQFVENLLKAKDEELKVMKKELQEKRLSVTFSTRQLNDVQHKLRNMESKANKLHAHNIQLSVKLEEMKTKYEGEASPDTRLERGRVEDIPDFNPEMAHALLGTGTMYEPTPSTSAANHDAAQEDAHSITSSVDGTDTHSSVTSDISSLSEIQNTECRLSGSPSGSPGKCGSYLRQRTPGLYFTKTCKETPMSSVDSLWDGGQVNAKSCDNSQSQVAEKKVINVKATEQDVNNCPTQ